MATSQGSPGMSFGPFSNMLTAPSISEQNLQQPRLSGFTGPAGQVANVLDQFMKGAALGRFQQFQQNEMAKAKQHEYLNQVIANVSRPGFDQSVAAPIIQQALAQQTQDLRGGKPDPSTPHGAVHNILKGAFDGILGPSTQKLAPLDANTVIGWEKAMRDPANMTAPGQTSQSAQDAFAHATQSGGGGQSAAPPNAAVAAPQAVAAQVPEPPPAQAPPSASAGGFSPVAGYSPAASSPTPNAVPIAQVPVAAAPSPTPVAPTAVATGPTPNAPVRPYQDEVVSRLLSSEAAQNARLRGRNILDDPGVKAQLAGYPVRPTPEQEADMKAKLADAEYRSSEAKKAAAGEWVNIQYKDADGNTQKSYVRTATDGFLYGTNGKKIEEGDPRAKGYKSELAMGQFMPLGDGSLGFGDKRSGQVAPVKDASGNTVMAVTHNRAIKSVDKAGNTTLTLVNPNAPPGAQPIIIPIGKLDKPQQAPASSASGGDAAAIADAIRSGDQPPDFKGLYRMGAPVRASLARNGYNLVAAQRDWQAVQRNVASLNGPQQLRLRQAVNFSYDSLDVIDGLYSEWKKEGVTSGIKVFNRASLAASKNLPGNAGAIATALEAQINDLTAEMGTVYQGGNTPTEVGLHLASANLQGEWNDETFRKAMGLMRTNLQIRRNSINNSQPQGVSADSPYVAHPDGQPTPTAPTPNSPNAPTPNGTTAKTSPTPNQAQIAVRASDGNTHYFQTEQAAKTFENAVKQAKGTTTRQ